MKALEKKDVLFVSFMLFSLFFGAGNLIFPSFLGQSAGEHVWLSMAGFIISAVSLPIMGVMAVAQAGSFRGLMNRVYPWFAFLFPLAVYLSIGPGLAIPRAGSLAFEMGVGYFLPEAWGQHPLSLLLYTVVFFSLVYWLALTPSKLVERFGKLLTPILLALIVVIFIKSLLSLDGVSGTPVGSYLTHPFVQGFLDGYQTMDALGSIAIGIVVVNTLRARGITESKSLTWMITIAGIGAALLLTSVYLILGFLGASNPSSAPAENGAQVLTQVMTTLFGQSGALILGAVFTVACLCVSIGLVTACGQYFSEVFPRLSYQKWVAITSAASMLIANLGLTQILKISVPILGFIYPVAIVMIILSLTDRLFHGASQVYKSTVLLTLLYSLLDSLANVFAIPAISEVLALLPYYKEGMGWILPAIAGFAIGYSAAMLARKHTTGAPASSVQESGIR